MMARLLRGIDRLAATRHEAVALELSSGECGAAIQPVTSWALAALDRPPNGRIADLSAKLQGLTQIPGVMWEVASLSKPVTEWGPPRIGTAG